MVQGKEKWKKVKEVRHLFKCGHDNEPHQEHTAVEFPNEVSLLQDEAPIPNLPYHDGFHIKTHLILDGECYASSSCDGVLNMRQLLY